MSVPGIGPIISSAMVAAIGTGDAFTKGRDFAAWLGLVPKQMSTGDRTILGKISRRGNRYLRVLFVQAAWVVLITPKIWVAAIALANKTARMVWAIMVIRGSVYMTDLDTGQTNYNLICYCVSTYMGSASYDPYSIVARRMVARFNCAI